MANELFLTRRVTIPSDVVFQLLDDEAVLLNLKTGVYFGLDAVGTRAWQLLAEHHSLQAVLEVLLDEYDVERGVLERDLLDLGRRLQEKGLVALAE